MEPLNYRLCSSLPTHVMPGLDRASPAMTGKEVQESSARTALLSVAVVIPALDEAVAIGGVVREIPRELVREIIVVDGGRRHATAAVAAAAGARVLVPDGRGYGRACAAGAEAAAAECGIIVFMDGDGADRGDLMARLVEPIRRGTHDFVIASRTRGVREPGSMSWHQSLAGRLAGLGIGALYGTRYSDMCAYRAIRRDCLDRLALREMTYGWNIEMQMAAARTGLRILEVPMPYRRRSGGTSKVAGSLRGTLRAGYRIFATFLRVATAPQQ
jgi:glycosyltransferase involved in cell wall biosynthesis